MLNSIITDTYYEFSEYQQVSLIYHLEHLDFIKVTGKDVIPFFHRITTSNIKQIKTNGVCQTIFTNDKGRIIDSVFFVQHQESMLIICTHIYKQKLLEWINKYTIIEDVILHDNKDFSIWQLWNIPINTKPNMWEETLYGQVFSWSIPKKETNTWVLVSNEKQEQSLRYLKKDFPQIKTWDKSGYEYYRIQQGIPIAPNELNDKFNPHEANLTYLVDFDKGCYIGQEVIARLDTYDKVKQHLHIFQTDTEISLEENNQITDSEGKTAGNITSFHPKAKIGLAYISKKYLDKELFIGKNKIVVGTSKSPIGD